MVDLIKKELRDMYKRQETIPVCLVSWEDFKKGKQHHLEHRINGVWINMIPPVNNYENYTHGLCTYHLKEIQNHSLRALEGRQKQ